MGDHTESVQVDYDPEVIGYEALLDEFWASHSPLGIAATPQYASIVFYATDTEREAAEASKREREASLGVPLQTRIESLRRFYRAEEYHQHYYARNGMLGRACPTARQGVAGEAL